MRMLLLTVALAALLASCAPPLSQADAQATAQVAGCWPGAVATPRAVTVTPLGVVALPSTTTPTALPTTTAYPRCTPGPGTPTLPPTRTAVPTRPPYPTRAPDLLQGGSAMQTALQLPGTAYAIDLAAHPTEGWPVVGVLQRFSISTDPIQSFVRVFNPGTRSWGAAQQVDIGASSNGTDRNGSTAVGVTGDRMVHAVWGGSDANPEGGIWTSFSRDFGASWSAPALLADHCATVLDLATSAAGWIVVLAQCYARAGDQVRLYAGLLVRDPAGMWAPLARLPAVPATFGAVVIAGDGAAARAVALTTAHGPQGDTRTLYLTARPLAGADAWTTSTRAFAVAGIADGDLGDFGVHVRGLTYTRPGQALPALTFMFCGRGQARAYALTSSDSGASWGQVEAIASFSDGRQLTSVTPAYDVAADALIALWVAGDGDAATHYGSWSVPGSGVWQPALRPGVATPLVLGSRNAGQTASAQAANARVAWVAWVEGETQVVVRSLNLNQVVPRDVYPTSTPQPTGGQP